MLKIRNLESGYGKLKVLKHISMHVDAGEIVTIIGANGAGKTTLLSTISGLIKATSGEIKFHDNDLCQVSASNIPGIGCAMLVGKFFYLFLDRKTYGSGCRSNEAGC